MISASQFAWPRPTVPRRSIQRRRLTIWETHPYPITLTPEQEAHLQHLSTCSTAPFAELPIHASWLDQVEIIFSTVQREVLTPNDFPSTIALNRDLMASFEELNRQPKPVQWTYTKTKLIAKFDMPSQEQLAA